MLIANILPMKKKLYIIPGFGETTKDKPYKEIQKNAKDKGYEVIPIDLSWSRNTMSDWIREAREKVLEYGDNNSSILGFSFGAFVAVELSKEFSFKKIFVCSLSPYYSEDLKFMPKVIIRHGKKRVADFKKYKFPANIKIKAVFMVGDSEWKFAQKRVGERFKKWKGTKSLKIINDSNHDIGNPEYLKEIKKEL